MGAMGRLMAEVFDASKREERLRLDLAAAERSAPADWKERQAIKRLRKEFRDARKASKRAMGGK